MRKILFAALIIFLFSSCPSIFTFSRDSVAEGRKIKEYPSWCSIYTSDNGKVIGESSNSLCFGYSDWDDWQSDKGKLLHPLVNDDTIPDSYNGKYRLKLLGQYLSICFNDSNSSSALFYSYIGSFKDYDKDRLVDINVSSDNVEYDCWFRSYHLTGPHGYIAFDTKCSKSNESKVVMTKIDDKNFNYSLIINGTNIIDAIFKNQKNQSDEYSMALIEKKYSWLPACFKEIIGVDKHGDKCYGQDSIDFYNENNCVGINRIWLDTMYCFEGISLRAVDEENRKISFWLEDREQSDFADYFEIHITEQDWYELPDAETGEGGSCSLEGTFGFYKEGNPTPIRFYDERHSEFSSYRF